MIEQTLVLVIKVAIAVGLQSVRGFLPGVVRKRLNLKLSSEKVNGNRIYKIKSRAGGKHSARAAQRQPA